MDRTSGIEYPPFPNDHSRIIINQSYQESPSFSVDFAINDLRNSKVQQIYPASSSPPIQMNNPPSNQTTRLFSSTSSEFYPSQNIRQHNPHLLSVALTGSNPVSYADQVYPRHLSIPVSHKNQSPVYPSHKIQFHPQGPQKHDQETLPGPIATSQTFQGINVIVGTSTMPQFSHLQHPENHRSLKNIDPRPDPAVDQESSTTADRQTSQAMNPQNVCYIQNFAHASQTPQPVALPKTGSKRKNLDIPKTPTQKSPPLKPIDSETSSADSTGSIGPTGPTGPAPPKPASPTLAGLADRLRSEELEPQAEKVRQSFATLWLRQSCELSEDAVVPRNRIYARYVDTCSHHSVRPLNAASFGKLVRAAYPDIKTRRLGVRGHSRYHYCGFRLVGGLNNPTGSTPSGTPRQQAPKPLCASVPQSSNSPQSPVSTPHTSSYSWPEPHRAEDLLPGLNCSEGGIELQFHYTIGNYADFSNAAASQGTFQIPSLDEFIPKNTDQDVVTALASIYLSHCRALIEALRFMHIKKFLTYVSTFAGGLTLPIKKLLTHLQVCEWVYRTDLRMYKEMVQLLSPLALQDIPPDILNGLRSLAQFLPVQLDGSLAGMSAAFVHAKKRPAAAFCSLLQRLIRASETGLRAGKVLVDAAELSKMRNDWEKHVDTKRIVAREAPCAGAVAERILGKEVPALLAACERVPHDAPGASETEAVIYKWTQYLSGLPSQFPRAPARIFLLCMNALVTAAVREISAQQGTGFAPWWVVRCWVDEWMGWSAEMGGFLALDEEGRVEEGEEAQSAGMPIQGTFTANRVLTTVPRKSEGEEVDGQKLDNEESGSQKLKTVTEDTPTLHTHKLRDQARKQAAARKQTMRTAVFGAENIRELDSFAAGEFLVDGAGMIGTVSSSSTDPEEE